MRIIYRIPGKIWGKEFDWLHSILPWINRRRDWHWIYKENANETRIDIDVPPGQEIVASLLKLRHEKIYIEP